MKSITNELISSGFHMRNLGLFNKVKELEEDYYHLKNDKADQLEELEEFKYQSKSDDNSDLVSVSKKLSKILKNNGEKEMVEALILERSKVLDHFTLAYLAETGLKPSEIKLVQGTNSDGYFEMYFVKNSLIIMPGE